MEGPLRRGPPDPTRRLVAHWPGDGFSPRRDAPPLLGMGCGPRGKGGEETTGWDTGRDKYLFEIPQVWMGGLPKSWLGGCAVPIQWEFVWYRGGPKFTITWSLGLTNCARDVSFFPSMRAQSYQKLVLLSLWEEETSFSPYKHVSMPRFCAEAKGGPCMANLELPNAQQSGWTPGA